MISQANIRVIKPLMLLSVARKFFSLFVILHEWSNYFPLNLFDCNAQMEYNIISFQKGKACSGVIGKSCSVMTRFIMIM